MFSQSSHLSEQCQDANQQFARRREQFRWRSCSTEKCRNFMFCFRCLWLCHSAWYLIIKHHQRHMTHDVTIKYYLKIKLGSRWQRTNHARWEYQNVSVEKEETGSLCLYSLYRKRRCQWKHDWIQDSYNSTYTKYYQKVNGKMARIRSSEV